MRWYRGLDRQSRWDKDPGVARIAIFWVWLVACGDGGQGWVCSWYWGLPFCRVHNTLMTSCEQKFPQATLATLIAISTFATQTWCVIVGLLPYCTKSMSMRCWCRSSRDSFFIDIRSCILEVISWCCFALRPLLSWCTLLFLYNHCLCIMLIRLLMNLDPHKSTDPLGLSLLNIGCTVSINKYGICPSIKQSHPRLLIAVATGKKCECMWVMSSVEHWPCTRRYTLIIYASSRVTFASPSTSMTFSINWRSWRRQPGSMHLVKCFEFCSRIHIAGTCLTHFLPTEIILNCTHTSQTLVWLQMCGRSWGILPWPFHILATRLNQNVRLVQYSFHWKIFLLLVCPNSPLVLLTEIP